MATLADLSLPLDFAPMEAKLTDALPTDGGWWFEPKWDGFRCLAFRAGEAVDLRAKSGKPLARYFPDMVHTLQALPADPAVHKPVSLVAHGLFWLAAIVTLITGYQYWDQTRKALDG